ncbi:PSF1 domain protein [Taphrina deformans PYCC 5710]|uniref:DNA replication complex GINS protein PSF1 n=1 Tax=Taphrina deformans (strain PYCC 5710 / ATCC 11124 / CBS 356.35 / IMI 108563 / JCM 9778 / NBRC 8474) TaxID=1097556 RepID=S0BE42_TAPDE|nr:PSF1 domain protein [Taphrina deformans PYCC 5710]|eukprot:CCG81553.1 PSF1 domain protein [Taphrina deformans PYCC 5710]
MYGDVAMKLIADSKRTIGLDHLPPYQSELVRAVTREIRALENEQQAILGEYGGAANFSHSQHPEAAVNVLIQHLAKQRNKRCLLAYHRLRTDRIDDLCWSEQLNVHGKSEKDTDSLGPDEMEYARRYNELLAAYKGQWTDIDLTGSLEPPRDLYIDVRVLKDAGEIQTEYGTITLTKNSSLFVKSSDVERLIRQGYLQRI